MAAKGFFFAVQSGFAAVVACWPRLWERRACGSGSGAPSIVRVLCNGEEDGLPQVARSKDGYASDDTAPRAAKPSTPEQLATAFAYAYHDAWSAPNGEALGFMRGVYTQSINFYGKLMTPGELLEEKLRFAKRWPTRDYIIREGSLRVSCSSGRCTVSALIDWLAFSESRNKAVSGAASFEFALDIGDRSIARETGKVLKGERASPAGMLARWHDENGRCRGGAGGSAETKKACLEREDIDRSSSAAGWCYGRQGEYGFQMEWHICGSRSYRQ